MDRKNKKTALSVIIYALCCPYSGDIKYIGKTILPISKRYSNHLNPKGKSKRATWIRGLINKGTKPMIIELEVVKEQDWKFKEIEYINKYKHLGLMNQIKGGGGGSTKIDKHKVFIDYMNRKNYSQNTINNYVSYTNKAFTHINLRDTKKINSQQLIEFLNTIKKPNTRNAYIVALKLFYKVVHNQPKKLKNISYTHVSTNLLHKMALPI